MFRYTGKIVHLHSLGFGDLAGKDPAHPLAKKLAALKKKFPAGKAYVDYRIKEDITLLQLDKYNTDNLKPVIYNHKETKQTNIGFLAHEVQEYFTFLVSGIKYGEKTQSINYTGLIGVLTKEIQELKKRVSKLESV